MNVHKYEDFNHDEDCKNNEMVLRYISRSTTEAENAQVHSHLLTCQSCYSLLKLHMEVAEMPEPSAEDLRNIEKLWSKTPQDMVKQAFKEAGIQTAKPEPVRRFTGIRQVTSKVAAAVMGAVLIQKLAITGIVGFTVTYAVMEVMKPEPLQYDIAAAGLPYPIEDAGFRTLHDPGTMKWKDFGQYYQMAILKYKECDYQSAISYFESLESSIPGLLSDSASFSRRDKVRNYYFYYGLSILKTAQATQENQQSLEILSRQAAEILRKAHVEGKQLAAANLDRETYFLAIANWYAGEKKEALHQLEMIEADSKFFADSRILIDRWSDN